MQKEKTALASIGSLFTQIHPPTPIKEISWKNSSDILLEAFNIAFHDSRTLMNRKLVSQLKDKRIIEIHGYDQIEEMIMKSSNSSGILPDLIGDENPSLERVGYSLATYDICLIYRYDNMKTKLIQDLSKRLKL